MKHQRAVAVVLFALATIAPVATFAEGPAGDPPGDRPGRDGPLDHRGDRRPEGDRGPGDGPPREGGPGGPGGAGGFRAAPPTDEEWAEMQEFGRAHAPNRTKELEQIQRDHPGRYRIARAFIAGRYRAMKAMKENDPALYAARVQQVELEDRVFGMVRDGHGGETATEEQRAALRAEVEKLVDFNLTEREERIRRMTDLLDEQRKLLEDDKMRVDDLVDQKMAVIQRVGTRALMPDVPHRRRGRDGRGEKGDDLPPPPPSDVPPPPPGE